MDLSSLLWQAVAVVTLAGPADPAKECYWPDRLKDEIESQACHLEVTWYSSVWLDDGEPEENSPWNKVVSCRRDYERLKDAPPMNDQYRFPPGDVAEECLNLAKAYVSYLERESLLRSHQEAWYMDAISDACALRGIWEHAWYLNRPNYSESPTMIREHLWELKLLLGNDTYMAGRLPLPVPVWRYTYVGGMR